MIIDVDRFVDSEKGYWEELEAILNRLKNDTSGKMELRNLKRFHYLYERASADLAQDFYICSRKRNSKLPGVAGGSRIWRNSRKPK